MDMNFFGGLVAGLAIGALVGAWLWRTLVLEDVLDLSGTSLSYWLRKDDMERIEAVASLRVGADPDWMGGE